MNTLNPKLMDVVCPVCLKTVKELALVGLHDSLYKCLDCGAVLYGWEWGKPCNCGSKNTKFDRKMTEDEVIKMSRLCPGCKEMSRQGVFLISVRDGETGDNPFRTGKVVIIKREAAEKIWKKDDIKPIMFIHDSLWKQILLPTKED